MGIFDAPSQEDLFRNTSPFHHDPSVFINKSSNYLLAKLQQRKRVSSQMSIMDNSMEKTSQRAKFAQSNLEKRRIDKPSNIYGS